MMVFAAPTDIIMYLYYHPPMGRGNAINQSINDLMVLQLTCWICYNKHHINKISRIYLPVCVCPVRALTFESFNLETSFSVYMWVSFVYQCHRVKVKVTEAKHVPVCVVCR